MVFEENLARKYVEASHKLKVEIIKNLNTIDKNYENLSSIRTFNQDKTNLFHETISMCEKNMRNFNNIEQYMELATDLVRPIYTNGFKAECFARDALSLAEELTDYKTKTRGFQQDLEIMRSKLPPLTIHKKNTVFILLALCFLGVIGLGFIFTTNDGIKNL